MEQNVSFASLTVVLGIAFVVPVALGCVPWLRIPAVVVEIVLGIVVGPQVLDWARVDAPVGILSVIGLAFLLFLCGLEVDLDRLRGRVLHLAVVAFGLSLVLALAVGAALDIAGLVRSPVLAAIILTATSLGLVLPTIREGGRATTEFGQLVFAGATLGNLVSALLLSLLFSRDSNDVGTRIVLLGGFAVTVAVLVMALNHRRASMPVSRLLVRLQDTSAQVRVRGAMFLLLLLVLAAQEFGLAAILGAFVAGAVLSVLDRDGVRTHPLFRVKLDAIGYGFVIPVFMVAAGLLFDLDALVDQPSVLLRVPLFLLALLIVRGVPALVFRPVLGTRRSVAAGLLLATSLPFIVAATEIGQSLDVITRGTAAAFVTAGLLSALLFPLVADALLRADARRTAQVAV
ncbi:MAG TPA: cation:proton antiporter [Acidimicrobiia bacterium]